MKITLKNLHHKNGKPVRIQKPKLPKGFRAAARLSGKEMRELLRAKAAPAIPDPDFF